MKTLTTDRTMTFLEEHFREVESSGTGLEATSLEDLQQRLNVVMRHLRIKALALLNYGAGICQSKQVQDLVTAIEGRAASHGTVADDFDELLATEALYDKDIISLEQAVELDMLNRKKEVRIDRPRLADLLAEMHELELSLRNAV